MARLGKRAEGLILDDVGEKIVGDRSVSDESSGYPSIVTSRKDRWKIHRYLWEKRYGEAPAVIDHINGNPKDNRFSNLRAATQTLNSLNVRRKTTALPQGVYLNNPTNANCRPRYRARIRVGKQKTHIGTFDTPEEAAAAYKGAAAILILEEQLKAEKEWLYE